MAEDIRKILSDYIAANVLKQPGRAVAPDEKIISSGMIDSFSAVDLALFVEERFRVRIADTELDGKTFDTVEALAALIEKRKK